MLITGASNGIGLLTAVTLARQGWHVLATMRDLRRREKLENAARDAGVLEHIEIHALDVTSAEQIAKLSRSIADRGLPLHALVNNAGVNIVGFAEGVTGAELRKQFDINFFGATEVTRAFLPQMIQQKFGHIVMVSSMMGWMGCPRVSSYAASKFALEGWSEALRLEMTGLGIQVVLVQPGSFDTDMTRNAILTASSKNRTPTDSAHVEPSKGKNPRAQKLGDPRVVADKIAAILEIRRPNLRYAVGMDAKMGLLMRRVLPWSLWERWILKLSGMDNSF